MAQGTRDKDRIWIRKILFDEDMLAYMVKWCDVGLDILELPVPKRDEPVAISGEIG